MFFCFFFLNSVPKTILPVYFSSNTLSYWYAANLFSSKSEVCIRAGFT